MDIKSKPMPSLLKLVSLIVRTNSCKLAGLSHKTVAQAMWKPVKLVTGSKDQSNNKNIHNITATQPNAHYAKISHDLAYITPVEKRTVSVNKAILKSKKYTKQSVT